VAANCVRTLLLQSPKTPADQSISRFLLPRLIAFVTKTETEDPENARSLVSHALATYVTTLSGPQKGVAMSIIMPTLLSRANKEGEDVYQETSSRLLELAASDQTAFRAVVGSLSSGQKSFMESVIVAGRKAGPIKNVGTADTEGKEPTIALRMNFGG
jgi:hypothetical protein